MNILEKTIAFFSPQTAAKREAARQSMSRLQSSRGYEAAQNSRRKALLNINSSSAREVSKATNILAADAQEACRNNPLAQRVKMCWANSIVGKGITPEYKLGNKRSSDKVIKMLEMWASSTDCDFDGVMNLAGLQWLWAASVVETGGCFIRIHINRKLLSLGKFPLQFQTIEQTYLDKSKNDGDKIVDGLQYNDLGQLEGYWLYTEESGLNISGKQKSKYYKKDEELIHLYRRERAGQHLGVTWLAQVLTLLDKYNTLQDAVIMQQQIAACLGVIVQEADTPLGTDGDGTEDRPDEIYPGSINYLKSSSTVTTVNPPKASDQGQLTAGIKNDIAAGVNLTYAQLTTDYSKFNFASGRMGKNDFFETLDHAQYIMMLPCLDKIAGHISNILDLMLGKSVSITWAFPARTMVNPKEDLDYIISRVRSGLLAPSAAARMLGLKLEEVIEQWKKDKVLFGELPFDLDPSKFSYAGNQLDDNDAASANNPKKDDKGVKDATDE